MGYQAVMRRFALAAALAAALVSPALAQDTPNSASLGQQLHAAIGGDAPDPATAGPLLRDAVNSLGGTCINTQSYQVFRRTPDTDTLKVECANRPIYLLSIDEGGHMLLSGGNGQVQAMSRDDGEVILTGSSSSPSSSDAPAKPMFKLPGERDNDAIPESAVPGAKKAAADPDGDPIANGPSDGDAVDETDPRGWTRWVFSGGLAAFGILAFLGYSQLKHHARFARGIQRVGTYTSEEKDRMLAESAELKPDFYIHPSGLFIVRGKRGKRRLFPNRFYAYLYWRYGLKVAQIR